MGWLVPAGLASKPGEFSTLPACNETMEKNNPKIPTNIQNLLTKRTAQFTSQPAIFKWYSWSYILSDLTFGLRISGSAALRCPFPVELGFNFSYCLHLAETGRS